jgi:hypothetical protein
MLSRSELARLIDGPALDREIERLGKMGGGWISAATVLSRRVNWTVDWADLGPVGSRFRIVGSRGEAVIFWDEAADSPTLVKLRGREENGYGSAGFGCILTRDSHGRVTYAPGTLDQTLERERLSWQAFGFSCRFMDIIEDEAGLLLAQDFIEGTAPTEKDIHAYMTSNGWEWQCENREVSPTLASHAWRKGDVGAFDANETNFIKSAADGLIYPIDLIVWHWPQ